MPPRSTGSQLRTPPSKPRLVPELLQRTEAARFNDDPERGLVFARAAHELIVDQLGDLDNHPPALVDSYQRVARLMSETGDPEAGGELLLELIEEASDETVATDLCYPYLLVQGFVHFAEARRPWEAAKLIREAKPMLRDRLEEGDWMLQLLDVVGGDGEVDELIRRIEREGGDAARG